MLYCIMGNAGVGKDTICRELSKKLNIPKLITYTTRPQRKDEEYGDTYYFIDIDRSVEMCRYGTVAEYRGYKVANGSIWRYLTKKSTIIEATTEDRICVASLNQYGNYYQLIPDHIIPIILNVCDEERYLRMLNRDPLQDKSELNRRFSKDKNMLNIDKVPTAVYIYNRDIESTVDHINDAIDRFKETGIFNLSKYLNHDMAWCYIAKKVNERFKDDYYTEDSKVFGL